MNENLHEEAKAFDAQILERIENGHIPDLRYCKPTDYFYNNEWRDPEYVKISLIDAFELIDSEILKAKGSRTDIKILEVGCGPGFISLELARAGYDVTGIDVSDLCVKVAKDTAKNDPLKAKRGPLNYLQADFQSLSQTSPGSFDVVLFFGSLHHFPDTNVAVQAAKRLLRKDGLLICHEPTADRATETNAAFIYFLRALLSFEGNFFKKYPLATKTSEFAEEMKKIYSETRQETATGEKRQSVNDHEAGFAEMIPVLEQEFVKLAFRERSAFFHENIGGLRFDSHEKNAKIAQFLRDFDRYACEIGLLQPTEFFFVGRKS